MEKYFTITELSKEIDLSRQAIYNNIRKSKEVESLFTKDCENGVKGSYKISQDKIKELAELLNISYKEKNNTIDIKYQQDYLKALESQIESLKEQINYLEQENNNKSNQIDKLLQINANNQLLLLKDIADNKNIVDVEEQAENTTEPESEEKGSQEPTNPKENKSFWQRIFNK